MTFPELASHGIRDFVALDFETTGLSPVCGDRIIEIGAVRIRNGSATERFESLVNPGRPLSPQIVRMTGLDDAVLGQAPDEEHALSRFLAFLQTDPLVAHNAVFERRFLEDACRRRRKGPLGNAWLCSLRLARYRLAGRRRYRLDDLLRFLRLPKAEPSHRALPDAINAARLWLALQPSSNGP